MIDTAQSRYDKANRVAYSLRLNKKTDADIIKRLEEVKATEDGMQGYIKRLIRQDITKD